LSGQLDASFFRYRLLCDAESLQLGDVGRLELGHVRHVEPAAVQVGGADLHQAAHRHFFDFTEAAEIDGGDRRDTRTARTAFGRCLLGLVHHGLDVGLDVFLEDAPLRPGALDISQVDAELACRHADRRTGVYLAASLARAANNGCGCRGSLGFGYALLVRCHCLLLRRRLFAWGLGLFRRCGAFDLEGQDQVAGLGLVAYFDR
jgi:hypothetical protein